MTDKKLLELAAKAAGVVGEYVEDYSTGDYCGDQFYTGPDCGILTGDGHLASVWNPLTDDGDALRLAVRLDMQLTVDLRADESWVSHGSLQDLVTEEFNGLCPYAATRRVIVRAAAAIGRSM